MNNSNLSKDRNTDSAGPARRGFLILILVLLAAICSVTFMAVSSYDFAVLIPLFAASTAFLTYLLSFVRSPFVLIIPCVTSFFCTPDYLPGIICLSAMLVCAGIYAMVIIRRVESFRFFMLCALIYSVIVGAVLILSLLAVFGSLTAGLEFIADYAVKLIQSTSAGMDEKLVATAVETARTIPMAIPSVIFLAGIIAAWITKWTLTALASNGGVNKKLFSRTTGAPVGLAIFYMLLSLFGLLFALSSERTYFAYANLQSVLSVVFMGEGVRELIALFKRPGGSKRKFVIIAATVAAVSFMSAALLMNAIVTIVAYYGAYRAIFKRVHVITITKK